MSTKDRLLRGPAARVAVAAVAAAALGAGFGACGSGASGGDRGGGGRADSLRDATLNYARCMRANGVDMPDPKTDENGVTIESSGGGAGLDGGGVPSSRVLDAERKCRKHMDGVKPPQLSPEQSRQFRQQALAHARCMRENGVDFPDPQFSEDGGVLIDGRSGSGLDPTSPTFKRADEKCRDLAGTPGGAGGGS